MRRVNNMEVIKRDGSKVAFDGSKIENAILKAMRYGSGIVKPEIASKIYMKLKTGINQVEQHLSAFIVLKDRFLKS